MLWRLRYRLLAIAALLAVGGLLFRTLSPVPPGGRPLTFIQAVYYTWSLVFGEPPQDFPEHPVLEAMFFVVPVLGLVVILESLVELGLMIRDRKRNEREWCRAMCEALRDHVILVGLGRLGFRTYTLLRRLGVPVVVIERDASNQFLEDVRRDGTPLLIGDARREILLNDANARRARSIILATTDDLANLECALDARAINPDIRVVLRMFDQNMAEKVGKGFGIHTSMSQAAISAPAFATAAVDPDVINSVVVDNQLVVMKRWTVHPGGSMEGRTVGQLMDENEIAVVEWVRPPAPHPGGRHPGLPARPRVPRVRGLLPRGDHRETRSGRDRRPGRGSGKHARRT